MYASNLLLTKYLPVVFTECGAIGCVPVVVYSTKAIRNVPERFFKVRAYVVCWPSFRTLAVSFLSANVSCSVLSRIASERCLRNETLSAVPSVTSLEKGIRTSRAMSLCRIQFRMSQTRFRNS